MTARDADVAGPDREPLSSLIADLRRLAVRAPDEPLAAGYVELSGHVYVMT
jgi:hypothetical protein